MNHPLNEKYKILKNIIHQYKKIIVAFSGGLDSAFLLKTAVDVIGKDRVIAVTAISESMPIQDIKDVIIFSEKLNILQKFISTDEFENKKFLKNTINRCYFCKKNLFKKIKRIALEQACSNILYGANYDDLKDYRPGMRAALEEGIEAPLMKAKLAKKQIRQLAKNLVVSKKPSSPCLASRIPFGQRITVEKVRSIGEAEKYIRKFGFEIVRVRHRGRFASIEVEKGKIKRLMNETLRKKVIANLKKLGFTHVAMDLEGYRQGSLNPKIKANLM